MEPEVGVKIPAISFNRVVLPAPVAPFIATISPLSTENETLLNISKSEILFDKLLINKSLIRISS